MTSLEIWRFPTALGFVSAVGMGVALGTDGLGDVVSWLALSLPVVIAGGCVMRAYGTRQSATEKAR